MKKLIGIFTLLTVVTLIVKPVSAQDNIIKLRPAGVWVQTLKKVDVGFGLGSVKRNVSDYNLGITYERVLSENLSASLDFDIVFAGKAIMVIRPNVNYYLMDSAPNQLYVGGYFDAGFNTGGIGAHIGLGPKAGYQYLLLDDQLTVMGELGLGFGMFTDAALDGSGPGAGVNVYFTVGAGYCF